MNSFFWIAALLYFAKQVSSGWLEERKTHPMYDIISEEAMSESSHTNDHRRIAETRRLLYRRNPVPTGWHHKHHHHHHHHCQDHDDHHCKGGGNGDKKDGRKGGNPQTPGKVPPIPGGEVVAPGGPLPPGSINQPGQDSGPGQSQCGLSFSDFARMLQQCQCSDTPLVVPAMGTWNPPGAGGTQCACICQRGGRPPN